VSNELVTIVESQRDQFLRVVSDKSIEFDREVGFAMQILRANDYLTKIALAHPDSLRNAVTNVGAIGISLNPASKLAYLVPRKNAVCLDLSYMGLMHIAQQSGAIQWGQAVIVREKDKFELRGLDKQPEHSYQPFSNDRGPIVGVYVVVKTAEGDYLTHPMTLTEVYAIRDRSESWKAYEKDKNKKCPWVTDEGEMIKKTCVKQAAKYWPRRDRLDAAVHYMNTDGGEGITLKPNTMPEEEFEEFKKKIQDAETKEAAKAEWRKAVDICKGLGDVESAEKLKQIMLKHAAVLDEASRSAPGADREKAAA
jgi:recombination protein RecT